MPAKTKEKLRCCSKKNGAANEAAPVFTVPRMNTDRLEVTIRRDALQEVLYTPIQCLKDGKL